MHNKTVATGSGICFIFVYAFSFTIFFILNKFEFININFPNRFYIFNIILVLFSTMSFYDDLKNLHPNIRFFFQILFISLSLPLINIEILTAYFPLKLILIFIVFYWVYLINIINFIDGLDGFLIFYSFFYFFNSFIYFYFFDNNNYLYFISLILIAISISFYLFNKSPAKLFMGDSGSIFLGYIIGLYSLYFISINRYDIMITLVCYPIIDCSLTIFKKL